ncbi:MAG: methylated-DNA--[protein]-cysteine S-methyltransferase [Candidatus Gastranaerophilaceae bacterium]
MICKTNYDSPLGKITLACYANNIIGLWLENQKYFGDTVSEEMIENNNLEIFNLTKNWLDRYFAGEKPPISEIPIAPIGNEFRQAVWTILCEIPYGEVTTYRDIANKIAKQRGIEKMSAQAVGGAVGHNPIPIIIPCHRVVGKNGSLTGYAGGIKTKIKLLELEKVNMTKFFVPKNSIEH